MGQKKSTPSMLNPGDHIFSNRAGILYYHHGIYVGDDMVIHLMGAGMKKSSSSLCPKCGYNRDRDSGIVKTCLDCFLDGNNLHIFEYGMPCKSPDEVIRTATEFLQGKDFGKYNFAFNNCEDFASYCKTGLRLCSQRESFVRTVRLLPTPGTGLVSTPILQVALGIKSWDDLGRI
ncbi:hypothetical protein Patl1_23228 [Pistacia atlantica]|uniref:Uncharacterized protein n=1 Tax=Pistacia atlantica TaxID=434234 RepID=A0ACC0ZVF9_9ROSI|nr:hypothetical protein Patl1_23228 [Pistacia atlantica]